MYTSTSSTPLSSLHATYGSICPDHHGLTVCALFCLVIPAQPKAVKTLVREARVRMGEKLVKRSFIQLGRMEFLADAWNCFWWLFERDILVVVVKSMVRSRQQLHFLQSGVRAAYRILTRTPSPWKWPESLAWWWLSRMDWETKFLSVTLERLSACLKPETLRPFVNASQGKFV